MDAVAPPPDGISAPAGGLPPQNKEESIEKASSGSSTNSYNDDDAGEKEIGREKEVGFSPPSTDDVGVLEGGGKGGKKKDSFWRKKRQLNPLRWQPIPPIPEKQSVTREANASFFSHVTLGWIGPLMRVR